MANSSEEIRWLREATERQLDRHSKHYLVQAALDTRAFAETVPPSQRAMYLGFAERYEQAAERKTD